VQSSPKGSGKSGGGAGQVHVDGSPPERRGAAELTRHGGVSSVVRAATTMSYNTREPRER
jgi:hypothetical protein